MKKFFTLFAIMAWMSVAISQITVVSADLPQPGDTFMYYVDKTPTISVSAASANAQTWDFSTLGNDTTKYGAFGISSTLSFSSSFPTSNLYVYGPAAFYAGPGNPAAGFGYYMLQTATQGMSAVGMRLNYDGTGDKNITYQTPELLMGTPATYNSSFTNNGMWQAWINNVPTDYDTLFRRRIYKTLQVDAFGSLTTPYGSFSDVLRVKEHSVTIDSVFAILMGNTYFSTLLGRDTIDCYHFWTNGARSPICRIYVDNNNTPTSVEYLSGSLLNVDTIRSVADGNWTQPSTWDCNCVPLPGKNIIVNHNVILNTDFGWYSGSVTITNNGSLVEDAVRNFAAYGGSLLIDGALSVTNFAINNSNVTVNGTVGPVVRLYNLASLTNDGYIYEVDSLYNAGALLNGASAHIEAEEFFNAGNTINNGWITTTEHANSGYLENNMTMTSDYLTNLGVFYNNQSIVINYDMLNTDKFINSNTANIVVTNDFLNGDSASHTCTFTNNNFVSVGNNFLNLDTIEGFGQFCVAMSSQNVGVFSGTFDFCDNTPPSSAPFVDLNTGTIGNGITWCSYPCGTKVQQNMHESISLYPNPSSDYMVLDFGNTISKLNISLSDMIGRIVWQEIYTNSSRILIPKPANGVFNCTITTLNEVYNSKVVFH